jgi:arylsulfatase A-like enzyme
MHRSKTLLAALLLSMLTIMPGREPRLPSQPNVIFIVADSLRWDALGCNGGGARTPNLDQLAARGTCFNAAHSTAACTMPSSVALFTGNFASTYCVKKPPFTPELQIDYSYFVPDEETLLAEALGKRGYDCAASMENGLAFSSNNLQGFRNLGGYSGLTEAQIKTIEKTCGITNRGWDADFSRSCKYDLLYPLLNDILQERGERPFFMVKWFFAPHIPYLAPAGFLDRLSRTYARLDRPLQEYTRIGYHQLKNLPGDVKATLMKDLYLASVESLDERVGFILKALAARSLLDKTLIIFTADHGEYFGEHGLFGHEQAFYEPVLHVPLFISGPGIPAGRTEMSLVSLADLMPTLKELLGLAYPGEMLGRSFASVLRGERQPGRECHFDSVQNPGHGEGCVGLLADGWKLTVDRRGDRPETALYDLPHDPREKINLVGRSCRLPGLLKRLIAFRRSCRQRLEQNLLRLRGGKTSTVDWQEQVRRLKSLGYLAE